MEFNATFLVSAISFLVFVFLMNIVFYAPLEKIMNEREKLIVDTLNEAKNSKDKAQKILSDRDKKLDKAKNKGKEIIEQNVAQANNEARDTITEAKNKSLTEIENNKQKLLKQEIETQNILGLQVEVLADLIVSKVKGE